MQAVAWPDHRPVTAEHPRLVVLSVMRRYGAHYGFNSGFASYDPAWIDSLTRQVQQLRATGAKVLVLGPIPDPHSAVPIACLATSMTRQPARHRGRRR